MARPRWTIRVRIDGRIIGCRGYRAKELLESIGLRPIWLGRHREWTVDRRHLADVLAVVEHAGAALLIEGEPVTPRSVPRRSEPPEQAEVDLFGGGAG